jgi:hypothetical protein
MTRASEDKIDGIDKTDPVAGRNKQWPYSIFSIIQMSDWVLLTEKTNFFPSGVMLTE